MPFQRRWSIEEEDYIVDRELTGPPPVPSTGTTQTESGNIVGDASNVAVAPATPVRVTMPGPREVVLDANGNMTPRWRRFFEELYRRTGAIEDNINNTDRNIGGTTTTAALVLSGAAPTAEISVTEAVPVGTLTIAGAAPTVV
jgi:hypothetical protein